MFVLLLLPGLTKVVLIVVVIVLEELSGNVAMLEPSIRSAADDNGTKPWWR